MTTTDPRSSEWVDSWCMEFLGSGVEERIHESQGMSSVVGVRLRDGREVAVKIRSDDEGRAATCVAIQGELAAGGFVCATPVSPVTVTDGVAVHAEEWIQGGEMLRSAGTHHAELSGRLLADLMTRLESITVPEPPLPNPVWVQWDYDGGGLFPPNFEDIDRRAELMPLPQWITDVAVRIRDRMSRATTLRRVLGHTDWEAQNMRWMGSRPHVVHDWDSLSWLPEAAVVGAASGAFASQETPTLAPIESSDAFLEAYQTARGRRFDSTEVEITWATSLFPAVHNARGEFLFDSPKVTWTALREQLAVRLALAGA